MNKNTEKENKDLKEINEQQKKLLATSDREKEELNIKIKNYEEVYSF
jgi:hypothetical protein